MYRIALLIIMFLTSQIETQAQKSYENNMQEAFKLKQDNKLNEAVKAFENIGAVNKDNWLPPYYAAHSLIINAFSKKEEEKIEAQLKRAQKFINTAKLISKNNPEIMILQALLHTVYVAHNGAKYGMILASKVTAIYEQAYKIDPNNPRVVLSKTEWDMGTAMYFGQETKPFCKQIEKALQLFTNFKPETAFYPNWGQNRAKTVLKSCKQ